METGRSQFSGRLQWDLPKSMPPLPGNLDEKDSENPVLELACFVKPPRICFEKVKVGSTKLQHLDIYNPGDIAETVVIEKFPALETGFKIDGLETEELESFEVQPKELVTIPISWQPQAAGNFRHLIVFKWIGGQKLQVVILACSFDPKLDKKKKGKRAPLRKSMHVINKANMPAKKIVNEKLIKESNQKMPSMTPVGSNTRNLIEISVDTPPRRQTFTVAHPNLKTMESDKRKAYNDDKENYGTKVNDLYLVRDELDNGNSKKLELDNEKCNLTQNFKEKDVWEFGNGIAKVDKTFEDKFENNHENHIDRGILDTNTFHESEIRLSSSPIKWLQNRGTNNDLCPGQVVLNGEVKHQFIPYPSFNNTDTFLNMEMSTGKERKQELVDESLSFGSAASSLFTISREEKFSPHLETVEESNDGPNTLVSKTITNENYDGITIENASNTVTLMHSEQQSSNSDDECLKSSSGKISDDDSELSNAFPVREVAPEKEVYGESGIGEFLQTAVGREQEDSENNMLLQDVKTHQDENPVNLVVDGFNGRDETIDQNSKQIISTIVLKSLQGQQQPNSAKNCALKQEENNCTSSKKPSLGAKGTRTIRSKTISKQYSGQQKKVQTKNLHNSRKDPKNRPNVVDAKFKSMSSIGLPQKRRSESGPSSSMVKPCLAIKKLRLIKPKTKMPRHPMPYAAKNMFYDERWIEKQERGFKNWLNFVLTSPYDEIETDEETKKGSITMDSISNQPIAPTKEAVSFRLYAARRRMARLRRAACNLYQSDELASVICKVEREIEHGRLAFRMDRHVNADLGVRKHIADMLLSFNSLWLRIGLEVVYGEIIPMQSNNDTNSLSRFIHRRLLGNPDIAADFSHSSVPGLYKPGYVDALAKFTLKKLLLVVIFLDKAKTSRLIQHDPCLFRKESEFKTIRDMLLCFSKEFLHREGDLVKHLGYLGYTVTHAQLPLHEFDFGVTNLAVDLRDGLRLVRVVELLSKNWNLSSRLRVPAVSRLQKVHNVEVAFQGLKEHELDIKNGFNIDARYIVDGHREKTLLLLWQIIFHFQVDVLLDEEKLSDEIKHLEKNRKLKYESRKFPQDSSLPKSKRQSLETDLYFKSKKLGLLFRWCRLVCELHDVKVENFTVSFSDGRALCYLLHHYHPKLLPQDVIQNETSVTCGRSIDYDEDVDDELIYQNWTQCFSPTTGVNRKLEALLQNEKQNFAVFSEKVKEIGGSPSIIVASDMSNTIPDEKVVIVYLSFLCSRLLDIREEIRAARCIQIAWRQYHLNKKKQDYQILNDAATKLQAVARGFLFRQRINKMQTASTRLQASWRGYTVRKRLRKQKEKTERKTQEIAASKIQSVARKYLQRRKQEREQRAAIVLQMAAKRYLSAKMLEIKTTHAIKIQRHYRTFKLAAKLRRLYLQTRNATIKIQTAYRAYRERNMSKRNKAATVIQSTWKMYQCKQMFTCQKSSAIIIQRQIRMHLGRRVYEQKKNAAMLLQSRIRAYIAGKAIRCEYLEMRRSVVYIQRAFRMYLKRREIEEWNAAVRVQSYVRMAIERKKYLRLRQAVVSLQSWTRCVIEQHRYSELKKSTIVIQQRYRSNRKIKKVMMEYRKLIQVCVLMQALVRGSRCRRRFVELQQSVVRMQSRYRAKKCRDEFLELKSTAVKLQQRFRAMKKGEVHRHEFLGMKAACITIQSWYRGSTERLKYLELKTCTIKLQAMYRRKSAQKDFQALKDAAVCIQRRYQAVKMGLEARRGYKQQKTACITIQSWFRSVKQRQKYLCLKRGTILLQSICRRSIAMKNYQKMKSAAIIIQRRYRAVKVGQATQIDFLVTRAAAIVIQSGYRGYAERKELKQQHAAATVLQAMVRMHCTRKRYLELRTAVVRIQKKYRENISVRKCVKDFQELKKSTIAIQSIFRGYMVRSQLSKMTVAAIRIQAFYKGFEARKRYMRIKDAVCLIQAGYKTYQAHSRYKLMKNAAIKIQEVYRGHRMTLKASEDYKKMKKSVIQLQSIYRGYKARKLFKTENSARKIQTCFRAYLQRKRYRLLRCFVVTMQQQFRKTLRERKEKAVKILQAHWRAYQEGKAQRLRYCKQRQAAIVIQSTFRTWSAVQQYARTRNAALIMQHRYRAKKAMEKQRINYMTSRKSVVIIQSQFRMYYARREYLTRKSAAIKIQRFLRCCLQERQYQKQMQAASVIQTHFRSYLTMQRCRTGYVQKKKATVLLQASYRQMKLRRRFTEIKQAAIIIQCYWRMVIMKRQYQRKRHSAIVIQRHYRAYIIGTMQATYYHIMRGAVITIQAAVKGFHARNRYIKEREALIKLQAFARMHICRKKYKEMRLVAIQLQQRIRANSEMKRDRAEFLNKKSSCLKIQRAFKKYRQLKKSAVVVQTVFRMYQCRKLFIKQRNACIKIQIATKRYLKYKHSAIVIQSNWRMQLARKEYLRKRNACIMIQATVRRFLAQQNYLLCQGAALVIQQRFRAYIIGSFNRLRFLHLRDVCVKLQAIVRMIQCRRRYLELRDSAVFIQQHFKALMIMRAQRCWFVSLTSAVVTMQSLYRGNKARRHVQQIIKQQQTDAYLQLVKAQQELLKRIHASVIIQKTFRASMQRKNFLAIKDATLKIQQCYRRYNVACIARAEFLEKKEKVIVIQSSFRIYKARKELAKLRNEKIARNASAIILQKNFKRFLLQKKYLEKKCATLKIQAAVKRYLSMLCLRKEFEMKRECIRKIQSFYRCYRARKSLQMLKEERNKQVIAAVKIQSNFRAFVSRKSFLCLKQAAITIQRMYRNFTVTKKVRSDFLKLRAMAIVIQSIHRSHLAQKELSRLKDEKEKQEKSAIRIQEFYRACLVMKKQRTEFLEMKKAATKIQNAFRKNQLRKKIDAAIKIQRSYREYKEKAFSMRAACAVTIQSCFRGYLDRKRFQELKSATVLVQSRYRQSIDKRRQARKTQAAVKIQLWFRTALEVQNDRSQFLRTKKAALVIQSLWRGYLVRKSMSNRKVIKARERIKSANFEATESKKLGNRTKSALSYLLNCKNVTTIYEALVNLEVATRLSCKCSEQLVEDNALGVIFQVVRNCNRGLPSIELIQVAISVLINVSKWPTTYISVFNEKGSVQLFVELMSNFREKKTLIFSRSTFLLNTLCQDSEIAKSLKADATIVKKLQSIHYLMRRKVDLESKRNGPKIKPNLLSLVSRNLKGNCGIFDQLSSINVLMDTLDMNV